MPRPLKDTLFLLARLILGAVLIAHAWQKLTEWGLDGTAASFGEMGVPAPTLAAWVAVGIEGIGGILLILGLFTGVAGLLVAVQMAFAAWFAHLGNGVFVDGGGWELVGTIAAGALALTAAGPGLWSLDALLPGHRARN
ncbi:DoxX family protein [Kytococcus sp. Marseille-QA3725]